MNNIDKAKILKLTLKNIKSFKKGGVDFNDGITVISGENGSGKSTVIEAVGFCLFGVSARDFIGKQDDFVRFGHSKGEVEVEYEGVNGVLYKVCRSTRSVRSMHRMSEDGWFVVEDDDIDNVIFRTLGLKKGLDLSSQFKEIIGPFQTDFITPFTESGQKRIDRFNQVLGVDQWRKLYNDARPWDNVFQNRIDRRTERIRSLKEATEDLPELKKELKDRLHAEKKLKQEAGRLKTALDAAEKTLAFLRDAGKKLTALKTKKNRLEEKIQGLERQKSQQEKDVEDAGKAAEIVEKCREGYEEYKSASKLKKKLEKKRMERDRLKEEIDRMERKIEKDAARLDSEEKNLKEQEERYLGEIEKLKTQVERIKEEKASAALQYKEAKKNYEDVKSKSEGLRGFDPGFIKRAVEEIESRLHRREKLKNEIEQKKKRLQQVEDMQKKASEVDNLGEKLKSIDSGIARIDARITDNKAGKKTLGQGVCPFFSEECLNMKQKGLDPAAYFDGRLKELKAERETLKEEREDVEAALKDARKAVTGLAVLEETKKSLKKDESELSELESDVNAVLKKDEIQERVGDLSKLSASFADGGDKEALDRLTEAVDEFEYPVELEAYPDVLKTISGRLNDVFGLIKVAAEARLKALNEEFNEKVKNESGIAQHLKSVTEYHDKYRAELNKMEKGRDALKKDRAKLKSQSSQVEEKKKSMEEYQGLNDGIEKAGKIIEEREDEYNKYQRNCKAAQKLDGLKTELRKTVEGIDSAVKSLESTINEIKRLESGYSDEELEKAEKEYNRLYSEKAVNDTELKQCAKDIARLKDEIGEMKEKLDELKRLRTETEDLKKTRKFAQFLRKVFKQVGPRVSEILRYSISEDANDIYRTISDKNEELFWGDGFSVELITTKDGRTRKRVDKQLSGGQFMSSVIALRLALLKMVGSPFAFFDEPTSNLDHDRRRNLAELFRTLNARMSELWYRQLFLISHDESFRDISSNVVELELDDGETVIK